MPKIDTTEEAYAVLEAAKSEGYSFKRLASEAIIEKYGRPRHSMGPVQTHYTGERWEAEPVPNGEEVKIAAKLLLKHGGIKEKAVGELKTTTPNYKKIAAAIFELAGGEV